MKVPATWGGNLSAVHSVTTDYGVTDPYKSKLTAAEDYFIGVLLIVTGLIALILGSVVLLVYSRWSAKKNAVELYVVHLAVMDLLMVVIMNPFVVGSSFNHRWIAYETGCIIYGFLGMVYGLSSIGFITMLCFVRYVKMCQKVPDRLTNKNKIQLSIILIYCNAVLWSTLPLIGWGKYSVAPFGGSCAINWSADANLSYVTCIFVLCLFLPALTLFWCYGAIYIHVKRRLSTGCPSGKSRCNAVKSTFWLCAGFLTTWLPYGIMALYAAYVDGSNIPYRLSVAPCIFAKAAAAYNPVIYCFFRKSFRRELKQTLGLPELLPATDVVPL